MRKILVTLVLVATVVLVAGAPGRGRTATRVNLPGRLSATRVNVPGRLSATRLRVPGLSVRVPAGWHVLHGWLSDVIDPAPLVAVASFPARLSRHTCVCGLPNVVDFPHNGAFVFVWEYLHFSRKGLARMPGRPRRFHLADGGVRETCNGPSDTFGYKDGGRVFQVEVYLGPAVAPALRGRVAATLDSLRVAPNG